MALRPSWNPERRRTGVGQDPPDHRLSDLARGSDECRGNGCASDPDRRTDVPSAELGGGAQATCQAGTWDEPVRLYGSQLAQWKREGGRGRDIDDGQARLDLSSLVNAVRPRLAITTYQTLANYAVTFSETPFAAVVFDEIQNLKNPAAMRSEAAKAVRADFRIGLTGTPVENATREIWAVMDQLFPERSARWRSSGGSSTCPMIAGCASCTRQSSPRSRAPGARYSPYEKGCASDLPPKVRVLHPRIMPEVQAVRYDEIRGKGGSLFSLLHHIRRHRCTPG